MRHALFKHILLSGVSFGAVDMALDAATSTHMQRYSLSKTQTSKTQGLLMRVGVWLQLIFGGVFGRDISASRVTYVDPKPRNRHKARLRRRILPLSRRPDSLGYHLLLRYGRTRYLNWIYDRGLTPRITWCFQDWNWRWPLRACFAGCAGDAQMTAKCGAPLRPD